MSEIDIEAVFDRARAIRLVEALIFASPQPIADAEIERRFPEIEPVSPILAELVERYRSTGINLVRVAGGWQFRTAPDLAAALSGERVETRRMTRAQTETLAIIAYHQPVTRAEIEEIRGVTLHKGTLDLLIETGWIAPGPRRETPGRPASWVTTRAFLDHFGLDAVADLPNLAELKAAGLLDARPMQTLGEIGEGRAGTDHGGGADSDDS